MPELIKGLEEIGWLLPTPIQAEAVPLILGGGDVMAVCVPLLRVVLLSHVTLRASCCLVACTWSTSGQVILNQNFATLFMFSGR